MRSNIPEVKLGIIAVSRDCFIISLSERRRAATSRQQPLAILRQTSPSGVRCRRGSRPTPTCNA